MTGTGPAGRARDPTATGAPGPAAARRWTRRSALAALAALASVHAGPAQPHTVGAVRPPRRLPHDASFQRHDGTTLALGELVSGQLTALQLMFTGCSEVCAMQGAIFAAVQDRLRDRLQGPRRSCQLLSMSVDPSDDSRAMARWLQQFGAGPGWYGIVPRGTSLRAMTAALQGSASLPGHSAQVYFVSGQGHLIWTSEDLPRAEVIVNIAERLAGHARA